MMHGKRLLALLGLWALAILAFLPACWSGEGASPPSGKSGVDPVYTEMRGFIFSLQSSQPKQMADKALYAAVVDMDMGQMIMTLTCVADGSTSIYYSAGGGMLGLGQDQQIALTTQAFLYGAEQMMDSLDAVDDYPLPTEGKHILYLIGNNVVRRCEFDMTAMDTYPKEKQFLCFMYQKVLRAITAATQP